MKMIESACPNDTKAMPSEGRDRRFESYRVRHRFIEIIGLLLRQCGLGVQKRVGNSRERIGECGGNVGELF